LAASSPITGSGVFDIGGGTLDATGGFVHSVTFTGSGGVLELAQSQGYTGTITGFSTVGSTSLDLGDIGFVNSAEAAYSGTKTSGVLTVTDGTHTAKIRLKGDYLNSTFIASSDGHGGTDVVDPKTKTDVGPVQMGLAHVFIAAIASLGDSAALACVHTGPAWPARELTLAGPRVAAA